MSNQLKASIELVNQKVKYIGRSGDNAPIQIDYIPPIGDGEGYTSLELFLVSLASCSATAVIMLLRKMRKSIEGFSVNASGERREEHPTYFKYIDLEFIIKSPDVVDSDVDKAIQTSEDSICPVWGMIKGNVEVRTTFKIIKN